MKRKMSLLGWYQTSETETIGQNTAVFYVCKNEMFHTLSHTLILWWFMERKTNFISTQIKYFIHSVTHAINVLSTKCLSIQEVWKPVTNLLHQSSLFALYFPLSCIEETGKHTMKKKNVANFRSKCLTFHVELLTILFSM
jgi:hypothetical protein